MSDHKFSRLLRLNSDNANASLSDIANGKYAFNTNDNDLGQIRHVALKCALIPNTEYSIHSGNNVFNWQDVGVPKSVTIPVGQYTTSTLLTALNTLVQVITATMIISQTTLTQKLNFVAGVNIELESLTTDSSNTMAQVLGITSDSGVTMNWDAPSLPDLTGLKHVYIVSRALSNQTQLLTGLTGESKFPVFADVPITSSFGSYTVDNTNSSDTLDYSDFHSYKNCSQIDIQLVDESGRTVELNGLPWILILRVYG